MKSSAYGENSQSGPGWVRICHVCCVCGRIECGVAPTVAPHPLPLSFLFAFGVRCVQYYPRQRILPPRVGYRSVPPRSQRIRSPQGGHAGRLSMIELGPLTSHVWPCLPMFDPFVCLCLHAVDDRTGAARIPGDQTQRANIGIKHRDRTGDAHILGGGHTVTRSHGHTVTRSHGHTVTRSHGHTVTRPHGHTATRSHTHARARA